MENSPVAVKKMFDFSFILYFVACVSVGSAAIYSLGPCPVEKAMDNFNITAYATGKWFEIARYPTDWEYRGDCVIQAFYPKDGVLNFKLSDVVEHHLYGHQGYIEMAKDVGNTGTVNFFSTAYEESEGARVVPVTMVDTDYTNYLVAHNCKYDKENNVHHDFAWIMSRSATLQPKIKEAIEKAVKNSKVINMNKFIWMHINEDTCKSD